MIVLGIQKIIKFKLYLSVLNVSNYE